MGTIINPSLWQFKDAFYTRSISQRTNFVKSVGSTYRKTINHKTVFDISNLSGKISITIVFHNYVMKKKENLEYISFLDFTC